MPAKPTQSAQHTNVLLISLDSTRRDLLHVYGHDPVHARGVSSSPHLDRLAAEGVVLEQAYSTTSWTLPAHVSLLTGEPELVHAVDIDSHRADPERPLLTEMLREGGYRTAGFFSGYYLDPSFGFARGFERYEACYGPELTAAALAARETAARLAKGAARRDGLRLQLLREEDERAKETLEHASHRDRSAARVTDAALAELELAAREDRPFFLFAHYFDPHYDYVPPSEAARRFDPDYAGAVGGEDFQDNPAISRLDPEQPGKRIRVVGERDLEHVRALYAAELFATDAQLGRLFDRLEELGLAADTLVIVTSDHGDEFFEHGSIGHRSTLYEELVRVPLILRLPGRLPAGARVHGLVSLTDVVPTVLELTGVTPARVPSSGSILPLVDGRADARGRAVLGRLATATHSRLELPGGGARARTIPALAITLTETFRQGALKVTREVAWNRPMAAVPARARRALEEENQALRAREVLRWIDVERHPDERPEEHSTDFTDPAARAALRAFHDRYAELLTRRRGAELVDSDEVDLAMLRGLGYAGAEGEHVSVSSDEFVLPPPGHALLAAERGE